MPGILEQIIKNIRRAVAMYHDHPKSNKYLSLKIIAN